MPRHLRLEVAERVRADGSRHDEARRREAVEAQAQRLAAAGVTSIAVVFLHAYANPASRGRGGPPRRAAATGRSR